ncbi:maleylpyruvate isomerase family mycothiol-dependent enzyme [Actinomadura logoneensis]|nr:maleylpyruvate isomerase family mycothiol-dependent enzyme [Actinomadura logoneensis]
MTNWPILAQSHDALRTAVAAVADWGAPTPCADWTAAQVFQHAAGDQIGFAAFLTGCPGPSYDPFAPSGVLDGEPRDLLEPALRLAAEAWAGVATSSEQVHVPVPPNDMPAGLGVGACALDAAVHAWDLARSAGAPSPVPTTLARDLLPVAQQIVEPLRAFGAYAPALPASSGDEVAALMRYLGRDPNWTA